MHTITLKEFIVEPWAGAHITDVIRETIVLSFANEGVPVVFIFNGNSYSVSGRRIVDELIKTAKEVK